MKHILTILVLIGGMFFVGCGGAGAPTIGEPKKSGETTVSEDDASAEQTPTVNKISEEDKGKGK